jgi:hypothetical protein
LSAHQTQTQTQTGNLLKHVEHPSARRASDDLTHPDDAETVSDLSRSRRFRLRHVVPLAFALILLAIFAARLRLLDNFLMDHDEVWTIWQSIGTPAEILRWTPYDWTPLHYQLQGLWQSAVGFQPVVARLASVFTFLIGVACVFRLTKRLSGSAISGLIGAAAFGAFTANAYISSVARGHCLLATLTAAAFWLTLRCFHAPSWRRALPLGLAMAGMFYTHFASVLPVMLLGIFSAILQPRRLWAWWRPVAVLTALALPELLAKSAIVTSFERVQTVASLTLPPLPEALARLYSDFLGTAAPVYIGLCLAAAFLLLSRPRQLIGLTAIALTPFFAYILYAVFGFFSVRHLAWTLIGVAVLLGSGLGSLTARLRGANAVLSIALFVILGFNPPDASRYVIPTLNMLDSMPQLAALLRGGDVVVLDPKLRGSLPELWEYFGRVYFPNGLPFHPDGAGFRRVWYILTEGEETQPLLDQIRRGRTVTRWFGTWDFMTRLYEAPPDPEGVPVGKLTFHGAALQNAHSPALGVFREGETLEIRLWWRGERSEVPSLALELRDASGSSLQRAEMPSLPEPNADGWIIADWRFRLPDSLATGAYNLHLHADQAHIARVVQFHVKAW